MKTMMCTVLALLVCVLAVGPGCVLEDKVVELVLKGTTCVEFAEDHTSAEWNTSLELRYADSLRKILDDNDIDIEKMSRATLVSVSYSVIDFDGAHDWTISGFITVQRDQGEAKRMAHYTDQSVVGAFETPTYADLDAAGVAIINQALEDFLANKENPSYPIDLTFATANDDVDPDPTPQDPIQFVWKACLRIHVIY